MPSRTLMGAGRASNWSASGSTLLEGLESYWAGDDLTDEVGSRTLTNNNSGTFTAGKVGNAFTVASTSSQTFSRASDTTLQTGGKSWTIALWFRITNSADRNMASKADEWALQYVDDLGDKKIRFRLGLAGAFQWRQVDFTYDTNWHNVVAWVDEDANTFGVQVDGGTSSTGALTSYASASNAFYIGGFTAYGPSLWTGQIDEVGYWSRVLTSDERTEYRTKTNAGTGYPFAD